MDIWTQNVEKYVINMQSALKYLILIFIFDLIFTFDSYFQGKRLDLFFCQVQNLMYFFQSDVFALCHTGQFPVPKKQCTLVLVEIFLTLWDKCNFLLFS